MSSQGAINQSELMARIDNDSELLRELVDIFREDFPRYVENLRCAVREEDMQRTAEAAHSLKGMLANFAATAAAQAAAEIEQIARRGEQAALDSAMVNFDSATSGLLAEIKEMLAGAHK